MALRVPTRSGPSFRADASTSTFSARNTARRLFRAVRQRGGRSNRSIDLCETDPGMSRVRSRRNGDARSAPLSSLTRSFTPPTVRKALTPRPGLSVRNLSLLLPVAARRRLCRTPARRLITDLEKATYMPRVSFATLSASSPSRRRDPVPT